MDKMILCVIGVLFAFVFPLVLTVWWKKGTGLKIKPFIVGAVCFILFATVLESLLHSLVLMRDGSYTRVYTDVLLYTLYGTFAAGIFEETGRLFGFKVLLRNYDCRETAAAYGIGHGGFECMMILVSAFLPALLAGLGVSLGDPAADVYYASALQGLTALSVILTCVERISTVLFHVGASMIVFTAARDRKRFYLYPAAILLHALLDVPAALYQKGVITSMAAVEIPMLFISAGVFLLGKRILYSSGIPSVRDGEQAEQL